MDRPGDEFLPGPAFPADEHGGRRPGHAPNLPLDLLERWARPDQLRLELEQGLQFPVGVRQRVLPAELRRFWEQADPDPIAVFTFPMLHGPAHALEQLRMLQIGGTILVTVVEHSSSGIDTPADYAAFVARRRAG